MRKFLFLAFSFFILFLFTGCGMDLTVSTTVNPDLSGERVFRITIGKSDLREIGLTPVQVEDLIRQSVPKDVPLKIISNRNEGTFILKENFKNPTELKLHTQKMTGGKGEIELYMSGTPLGPVYNYVDKTPVENYYNWVYNALEKKKIAQQYKQYWVEKASAEVSLPGTDAVPAELDALVQSKIDLAAKQNIKINWNPVSKEGTAHLSLDLPKETQNSLESMGVDFRKYLEKNVKGEWKQDKHYNGGVEYSASVPMTGNISYITKLGGPFLESKFGLSVNPSGSWYKNLASFKCSLNPSNWLGSSNIESKFNLSFSENVDIEMAKNLQPYLTSQGISLNSSGEPIILEGNLQYPSVWGNRLRGIMLALLVLGGVAYLYAHRNKAF